MTPSVESSEQSWRIGVKYAKFGVFANPVFPIGIRTKETEAGIAEHVFFKRTT